MKKRVLSILVTVVFVGVGAMTAFAARPEVGQNYVDADNDGVCDNQGTNDCPNQGNGSSGQNYVDADQDGVCDNQGTKGGYNNGNGHHAQKNGNGQQVRRGCGRNRK